MLDFLRKVDHFIIDQLEKAVTFLQDWFFLSQRWLERGVMVLYAVVCAFDVFLLLKSHNGIGLEILADTFIFFGMWREYKETKTQRSFRRKESLFLFHRVFGVSLMALFFIINFIPGRSYYMGIYASITPVWFGARMLMAYLTVLDVDGLRGKAAKLSWQKLKELFGTGWLPQPQRG